MAENKVNRGNYVLVQGFMVRDMNLKGNELLIYAIIYGFSQAENQVFSGSLKYLADWTNSSKQGVLKSLKSLIDKGYIKKKDNIINGVKFCEYYTTELNALLNKVEYPLLNKVEYPIKQSLPNNIDNNIDNNINNNKSKKVSKSSYDEILSAVEDDELRDLYLEYIKMRKMIKSPMTDRALTMLIKKVNDLETDVSRQKMLLETAIMNNWKSVYPLKSERQNNSRVNLVNINGTDYEYKNGKYYLVGGSGTAVDPYNTDSYDLPF